MTPPAAPKDIKTNEELYLTGLRAQQFHDPVVDPIPYWEEALRRDPGDARVNTAMGITSFGKARYEEAEKYLRAPSIALRTGTRLPRTPRRSTTWAPR